MTHDEMIENLTELRDWALVVSTEDKEKKDAAKIYETLKLAIEELTDV